MKMRIVSGAVAAVLLIALLLLGTAPWVLAVCLLCGTVGVYEFVQMFFPKRSVTRKTRMGISVALLILALRAGAAHALLVLWGIFLVLCLWHVFTSNSKNAFSETSRSLGFEMFGCFYVVSIFGFLTPIFELPEGRYYVLLLFLVVSMGDTAAYFVGSWFGRHKLASKISPNKTWEGAFGGVLGALAVAYAWVLWVQPIGISVWWVLKTALVGSILAQAGDLLESILKRSQGAKDSGQFLPGHGGLLDRVDGLALSAPVFYFLLMMGSGAL